MQVQINTDRNVEGREALAATVTDLVESVLSRVSDHITRVEAHLSDGAKKENARMLTFMSRTR